MWSIHGARGWYLGPSPNHYRFFEVYITRIGKPRIVDTVEFYPAKYKMTTLSRRAIAVKAAVELTEALQNMTDPKKIQFNNNEPKEIQKISTIFTDIATGKVFERRSDKQLPRVDRIYPDNSMEKQNNSPYGELPRVYRQVTKEFNNTEETKIEKDRMEWTNRAPTHRYPTRFKKIAIQASIEKEMKRGQAYVNAVLATETGSMREYRHLINDPKTKQVWNTLAANEFGSLMNGLKRGISGTGTMKLIHKYEVPIGQTVTYARFVCDYIPQKEEKHRTRITVGGDRINCPGNVTTRGANMTTIKLLLNSVVSTPDAIFITAGINHF